jgi:hypothetical protein
VPGATIVVGEVDGSHVVHASCKRRPARKLRLLRSGVLALMRWRSRACATQERRRAGPTRRRRWSSRCRTIDLDAEVFVDGNYVGQVKALRVPETGPILLAPGIHRVEVRKPGRFPVQRTVEVAKQSKAPVVVRAELLEDPA